MKHITPPVAIGAADSVKAYFGMAETPGQALPFSFPRGQSWISIDPALSSPNVLVGITGISSRPLLLAPGRVLPIDRECTSLGCFNVHHATLGPTEFNAGAGGDDHLYGRVVLVVGNADELPAWIASLKRMTPSPKMAVIVVDSQRAVDADPNTGVNEFPISNLSGLRISVSPQDAGGTLIAAPADFSVTLRPAFACLGNPRANYPVGQGLDGDPLDRATNSPITPAKWPNSDGDITFTQGKRIHDLELYTPAASMRFGVVAIAGTGVVSVTLQVEGRY